MRTYLGVLRRLFRGKSLSREIFSFSKSSLFLGTIPGKEDFSMRNSQCEVRIAQTAYGSLPPTQRRGCAADRAEGHSMLHEKQINPE